LETHALAKIVTMSDKEQKQQSTNISPQPDAEKKTQSTELSGGRRLGRSRATMRFSAAARCPVLPIGKNLGRPRDAENPVRPLAPAPPQQRTGKAQQCRRHKALMRHTAASWFPSTRVALRFSRSGSCNSGKTQGG
jgi:hypothetical protein